MENTMLFGNDILELEELLDIVDDIRVLYDKLSILEILGKKESNAYKNALSELGKKIYLENEIYKRLIQSDKKCINIINHLNELNENKSIILFKKRNNKIYYRIISYLEKELTKGYDETTSLPQIEFITPYMNTKMKKAFDIETLINSLTILEEYINNKDYGVFRVPLINIKYDSSFFNKEVETDMLNKGFIPSNSRSSISKTMADFLKLSDWAYQFLSDDYANDIASASIFKLLDISDFDYKDKNYSYASILLRLQIRATLLLLDDRFLPDFESSFEEYSNSDKFMNSKVSIQFVREVIEKAKTDKKIYKSNPSDLQKIYN